MANYQVTEEQQEFYKREGYLVIDDYLSLEQYDELVGACNELGSWPETPGKWMHYFEKNTTTGEKQLCRSENFTPFSPVLKKYVSGERVTDLISQICGEPYVIFKEKLNYKLPGGKGFPAHQDFTTFTHLGQTQHVTVLYTIDPMTIPNGCLQVVPQSHTKGTLEMEEDTSLAKTWQEKQTWVNVLTKPGSVVIFGSYLAHRSGDNTTSSSRRALYLTYNPLREGSVHEEYYKSKREHFPPPAERIPGKDYSKGAKMYNLTTPIED